jgi:hypothetical protein
MTTIQLEQIYFDEHPLLGAPKAKHQIRVKCNVKVHAIEM